MIAASCQLIAIISIVFNSIHIQTQDLKCPLRCIRLDSGWCRCFSTNEVQHDSVKSQCSSRWKGKVAAIDNERQFKVADHVQSRLLTMGYWVGIIKNSADRNFYYQDKKGRGREQLSRDSPLWARGQPLPRGNQHCVMMAVKSDLKYEETDDRNENLYVCQRSKENGCPATYTSITDKCVKVVTNKRVRHKVANETCIRNNAELATARTPKELTEISDVIKRTWNWNHLRENHLINATINSLGYPWFWTGIYTLPTRQSPYLEYKRTDDNRTVNMREIPFEPYGVLGEQEPYEIRTCLFKRRRMDYEYCEKSYSYVCDVNPRTSLDQNSKHMTPNQI